MDSTYGTSNAPETRSRKIRNALAIVLLVIASYQMGLSRARFERRISEYSALKAQYDRIEAEYSSLKRQYDGLQSEYSALRDEYSRSQQQNPKVTKMPHEK
jgi:chromosome segregation ATPase